MEALEALKTRRSVRAFTSRPVSMETVRELIGRWLHILREPSLDETLAHLQERRQQLQQAA